jgi:hypothetical protein
MLFEQYKVGNCGESTDVMISELNKNYPKMIVENVSIETPDHVFMSAVKMARLVNLISHYVVDISSKTTG